MGKQQSSTDDKLTQILDILKEHSSLLEQHGTLLEQHGTLLQAQGEEQRRQGALLEVLDNNQQTMLESMDGMRIYMHKLPAREEFNELKDDVKIVKAAATDTNRDVRALDSRVAALEAAN